MNGGRRRIHFSLSLEIMKNWKLRRRRIARDCRLFHLIETQNVSDRLWGRKSSDKTATSRRISKRASQTQFINLLRQKRKRMNYATTTLRIFCSSEYHDKKIHQLSGRKVIFQQSLLCSRWVGLCRISSFSGVFTKNVYQIFEVINDPIIFTFSYVWRA